MPEQPPVSVERVSDHDRYRATDHLVWFVEPGSLTTEEELVGVPPDQRFAALVDGAADDTYPGIYGVRPMQLSAPAATGAELVPLAGLTWVGVHPDHRRRGVLTAMMRHHVEQTHREGVALSGLHASEPVIYGRYGYGLASHGAGVTLSRGATLRAPGLEAEAGAVRTSLATETGAALVTRLRECELAVARTSHGHVVGDEGFYTGIVQEPPEDLRDKEPRRYLFATRDGRDVGHAGFRRTHKWERGRPEGNLEVQVLLGDPAARLALLRRLVDFDLMATVKLPDVGVDDPLWHWIGPRAAGDVVPADSLWLRIVDLPAALPQRWYAEDCDVVVAVDDPLAPWQTGRWRIVTSGGEGRAERTDAEPDAELPIAALGAAWLGGGNLAAMQRAGVLAERRPDAITALWRAFRTDVAPAAASGF